MVGKLSLGNISIGILNKASTENITKPKIITKIEMGFERAPAINFFMKFIYLTLTEFKNKLISPAAAAIESKDLHVLLYVME